jgi:hypothetical protein
MPTSVRKRKAHDCVFPEVRKPAGYGTLVAVIKPSRNTREFWFQHDVERHIIRRVLWNLETNKISRPVTIKAKGERDR